MFQHNILNEIFGYLSIPDLISIKLVNKLYYKQATNSSLYKKEFILNFVN